ncbi:hypothetical protein ACFQLX_11795 [Streptomyces polyrhachis]|uniref:Uncharacterized protein n=1 Tax=Streptomyces polyrhachis TaxID=1282885 RepID=A0ABW2GDH8_9ACTN
MADRDVELLALLRDFDDPQHIERPRGYEPRLLRTRFSALVARLESDFATPCDSEQDTQDSSEYGRVHVPAEATTAGTRIVVCVSKFGDLALVCADNPGAFLGLQEAQDLGELDIADLEKVHRTLVDLGYVVVPEELLERDYEGPSALWCHRPTWWQRYFGSC